MRLGFESVVIICTDNPLENETSSITKAFVGSLFANIGAMKEEIIRQDTYVKRAAWDQAYVEPDEGEIP